MSFGQLRKAKRLAVFTVPIDSARRGAVLG